MKQQETLLTIYRIDEWKLVLRFRAYNNDSLQKSDGNVVEALVRKKDF